jgi:hypothetical protein
MKQLSEYLMEARWGNAGGSIKHKLAPYQTQTGSCDE